MNAKDNGAMPAMPMPGVYDASRDQINPVDAYYSAGGLTKREHFAAMAMQGMAMRVTALLDFEVAHASVALADALLAELAKETA